MDITQKAYCKTDTPTFWLNAKTKFKLRKLARISEKSRVWILDFSYMWILQSISCCSLFYKPCPNDRYLGICMTHCIFLCWFSTELVASWFVFMFSVLRFPAHLLVFLNCVSANFINHVPSKSNIMNKLIFLLKSLISG